MASPIDFSGPYLKTERAKHHIENLDKIFRAYVASNKKMLTPKYNRKLRVPRALGRGFPKHTPTILGDALHNLRAALDHAYCELVRANGHTVHERSFFPIVNPGGKDSWQSRKASMEGHEKAGSGPGAHVIQILSDEVQPYPGGKGDDLTKLHQLDIADKHTILLPTRQHTILEDVMFDNHIVIRGIQLIHEGEVRSSIVPEGRALNPQYNNKASFEICFGDGQPFEGEPVLPILKLLLVRVNETLRLLEQRAKVTH